MPTVRLKLKKLTEVDVDYVSLVKRGANRIPIRVIKADDVSQETSEGNMDFLKDLFSSKQVEGNIKDPVVTSIMIKEGDWVEKFEEELKGLGFSIESKEKLENGVMYKQEGFDEDDIIIQLGDDAYITVQNVAKEFEPFSTSGSFSENFKKGGFFPNVRMATDVLMDTIVNIMFSAEGDTVPVESVTKAIDEFKSFVLTSLKSIPRDAFKLEQIIDRIAKEKAIADDNEKSTQKTEDAVDKVEIKKQIEEFLTTEQEQVIAKLDSMKSDIEKTLKSIQEDVTSKMSKMEEDLKALKEVSEGFDRKLVETTEKVEAVEKTVKGATASGSIDSDGEDRKKTVDVKKSDDDIWNDTLTALDSFSVGE